MMEASKEIKKQESQNSQEENFNSKRTKCERFSRIVGYIRPVSGWNEGKAREFEDRQTFDLSLYLK